ncbi:MAG: SusC/RagA family TonB-linked outer membrane protein, partial [Sphingobacteriales bacterium]
MNLYTQGSQPTAEKPMGFTTNYLNQQFIRAMKIFIFLMTVLCIQVSAAAFSQRINISQKNVPLVRVLKEIKRQTGYFFLYDSDLVQQKSKPVTIDLKNAELNDVLTQALKSQPFGWEIKDNTILIFPKANRNEAAKAIDVTGKIVDENGNPMPGASVRVKGQSAISVTDANGNFTIRNVDENATLVISYIGYTDREVTAKPQLGSLKLTPSAGTLSDVVVTGYT